MRLHIFAILLIALLLAPPAFAHSADTASFIMRNGVIQPTIYEIAENESINLYNVVDYQRVVELDHPDDSNLNWRCSADASNSNGTDDECFFWFNIEYWQVGHYEIRIYSNDSLWQTIQLTIAHSHKEHVDELEEENYNESSEIGFFGLSTRVQGILILAVLVFILINPSSKSNQNDESEE